VVKNAFSLTLVFRLFPKFDFLAFWGTSGLDRGLALTTCPDFNFYNLKI